MASSYRLLRRSYTYEDEEGVFPESQFVFDLELPASFEPRAGDGEVQEFSLLPVQEVGFFGCFSFNGLCLVLAALVTSFLSSRRRCDEFLNIYEDFI